MAEFKAGDKVRTKLYGEAIVVGPSQWPDSPGHVVIEHQDGEARVMRPGSLTLIPDTVTVTVELPRREAEASAAFMDLPGAPTPERYEDEPRNAAFVRLALAAKDALR